VAVLSVKWLPIPTMAVKYNGEVESAEDGTDLRGFPNNLTNLFTSTIRDICRYFSDGEILKAIPA